MDEDRDLFHELPRQQGKEFQRLRDGIYQDGQTEDRRGEPELRNHHRQTDPAAVFLQRRPSGDLAGDFHGAVQRQTALQRESLRRIHDHLHEDRRADRREYALRLRAAVQRGGLPARGALHRPERTEELQGIREQARLPGQPRVPAGAAEQERAGIQHAQAERADQEAEGQELRQAGGMGRL